jgi:hypothetical protein
MRIALIRRSLLARIAERSGAKSCGVGIFSGRCYSPRSARGIVLLSAFIIVVLVVTLPHTDIAANANTATLVSDALAQ